MKGRLALATAVLTLLAAVLSIGAGAASKLDRPPARLPGLVPDGWGNTTTTAERNLKRKYSNIRMMLCFPPYMIGYEASSSFIYGQTRYWDKLSCIGNLYSSSGLFTVVYDQKSPSAFIIYRLKGATPGDLG